MTVKLYRFEKNDYAEVLASSVDEAKDILRTRQHEAWKMREGIWALKGASAPLSDEELMKMNDELAARVRRSF